MLVDGAHECHRVLCDLDCEAEYLKEAKDSVKDAIATRVSERWMCKLKGTKSYAFIRLYAQATLTLYPKTPIAVDYL